MNNPQEAKGAYAALMPAATTLSTQVLGEIPKGLEQAIMAGQAKSWKLRGWCENQMHLTTESTAT